MKNKYRTVFWADSFTAADLINLKGQVTIPNGYSMDHFEYNETMKVRHPKDATKQDYKLIGHHPGL